MARMKGDGDSRGAWEMREKVENFVGLVRNGCLEDWCSRRKFWLLGRVCNSCCTVRRCRSRKDSIARLLLSAREAERLID